MSRPVETTKADETSLTRDAINLGRYYFWSAANWARPYLGGRRGLILLAVAVLGVGAALNWGWLVAIGVAPILLALAPCAAMCALGLCMRGGGSSCSSANQSTNGNPKPVVSAKPRDEA